MPVGKPAINSLKYFPMKKLTGVVILLQILICATLNAQSYDLQRMLKENKLITLEGSIVSITDGDKHAISANGIIWLKDVNFSTGTIDIDLRGKDVPQESFLGVVFHGIDTTTHDIVYFRPFNFQSTDSVRKIHAVQYVSHPNYPWYTLREERNGIYEKGIDPAPKAEAWFHATVVVDDKTIRVYVNHAKTPSLTVTKLNDRKDGLIGLFNVGLNGEFANLVIKR
jgi:hypothetical protein